MSYKDKTGAWVIPEKQFREFNSGIDYNKLIENCMKEGKPIQPKLKPKRVEPIEVELDLEDLEEEKPKGFLHRDVRSFFRG